MNWKTTSIGAFAGSCPGIFIGYVEQGGALQSKAVAALIAGGVLGAFGAFLGFYLPNIVRLFGNSWLLYLLLVGLVALGWSLY
jgi:hypothetical protein